MKYLLCTLGYIGIGIILYRISPPFWAIAGVYACVIYVDLSSYFTAKMR